MENPSISIGRPSSQRGAPGPGPGDSPALRLRALRLAAERGGAQRPLLQRRGFPTALGVAAMVEKPG